MVLLGETDDPAPLVREIKPDALLVAHRHHQVGVRRDLALRHLQRLAAALRGFPEPGSRCLQRLVTKRLPLSMHESVGAVRLQLLAGKGGDVRFQLRRQPNDHIDVAVPAQVRVVLVRTLEKDLVLELRKALVGIQDMPDGQMGLFESCPGFVTAPLGKCRFGYGYFST